MKTAFALLLLLASEAHARPNPWECRSATNINPRLPVVRLTEWGFGGRVRVYDPAGQTVLGLPATFLSRTILYGRTLTVEYSAVVRGDPENVRRIIEREISGFECRLNPPDNPDLNYICWPASTFLNLDRPLRNYQRYIGISRARSDSNEYNVRPDEGVLVFCSWTEPPRGRRFNRRSGPRR